MTDPLTDLLLLAILGVLIYSVNLLNKIRGTVKYILRFLGGRFADNRDGQNPFANWED